MELRSGIQLPCSRVVYNHYLPSSTTKRFGAAANCISLRDGKCISLLMLLGSDEVPYHQLMVVTIAETKGLLAEKDKSLHDNSSDSFVWEVSEQSRSNAREAIGETVVGAIFRRGADREIHDLLRAFSQLCDDASPTLVVSAGTQECEAVKRSAFELGISEHVRLVSNDCDIPALVTQFDILALPIYEDAVPVAVLEAMAAGRPVITTAGSRLSKIISNGTSGYLVPEGDIERFALTLALLLKDPAVRKTIGAKAQAYAKRMYRGSLFAGRETYGYATESRPSVGRRILKKIVFAAMLSKGPLWHVRTDRDQFALTFDDGPDPIYTPRILDVLRSYSMIATFFLVGNRAEENLDLVRQIIAEGHEIANHSYTHPELRYCSPSVAHDEVRHADNILKPFQQSQRRFFRPPFGHVSRQCLIASWSQNCTVAMWSVDLKDYSARTTEEIVARLSARPIVRGDIVLYHGTNPIAIAALPEVIDSAIANKLCSVALSELIK
jgi:peptidoglycan/xylan/chitin deacetylase (PgdA/CDA1 family)